MHAFHARRINKDFVERPRQRQVGQLAAFELDRNQRLELTIFVGLVVICTDGRLHGIDEAAEDAVLVQTLDRLQFLFDLRDDRALLFVSAGIRARIEAGMKQFDNIGGNAGMLHQRRPHVVLRIGHADLPQKSRQRADQRNVAPGQTTMQRERVVAVILGRAPHHHKECRLQPRLAAHRDRSRRHRRVRSSMSWNQTPARP